MRAREERFIGNGNAWVADGHLRGWKITCSQCGVVKTITHHHGSTLAPNGIIKKMVQSGWYIGHKPEEDICVACRRKPKTKANGGDNAPAPEIVVASSVGDYFAQMRHCLALVKVAINAKQFNRAASLVDVALRGLERKGEVVDVIWRSAVETTNAQRHQEAVIASIEQQAAPSVEGRPSPPPQNDEDYARWLAELDQEREK